MVKDSIYEGFQNESEFEEENDDLLKDNINQEEM